MLKTTEMVVKIGTSFSWIGPEPAGFSFIFLPRRLSDKEILVNHFRRRRESGQYTDAYLSRMD